MGSGNVCVCNKYEGLYYIDNDFISVYVKKDTKDQLEPEARLQGEIEYASMAAGEWEYNDSLSYICWQDALELLKEGMQNRFPSFKACNTWLDGGQKAIMENGLFYIAVEDNQWSMAVELLQKDDPYGAKAGPQSKHYRNYLDGIKDCMLSIYPEIGTYSGAWTHGILKRDDVN